MNAAGASSATPQRANGETQRPPLRASHFRTSDYRSNGVLVTQHEWPSGVGGGQCSSCLRTTVVRGFSDPSDPLDDMNVWLCKPCYDGIEDSDLSCRCPVIVRGPSGDASCNCVLPAEHPLPHRCECGVTQGGAS